MSLGTRVRSSSPFHQRGTLTTERNPIVQQSRLWIAYGTFATGQQYVRPAHLRGPAAALTLIWDDAAIALPANNNTTAIAGGLRQNRCYVATQEPATNTVRLFRVENGIAVQVFSIVQANTLINHIYLLTETEIYFVLRSDTIVPNTIYRATDGATFSSIGNGSNFNVTVYAVFPFFATGITTPSGRGIQTMHDNPGTSSIIGFSGDLGATWQELNGTAINNFASGSHGQMLGEPDNLSGALPQRRYYANANGGGGIQTPFLDLTTGLNINPPFQFTSIVNSQLTSFPFYKRFGYRFLIASNRDTWLSINSGLGWTPATQTPMNPHISTHTWSIQPATDYYAMAGVSTAIAITTDYGTTWQVLAVPDFSKAVAFVGGRN